VKLKSLRLTATQITDDGCATLAAALDSGALPALTVSEVSGTLRGSLLDYPLGTPASPAALAAVEEALGRTASRAATPS